MAAKPAVQVQVSGATAEWIVERPMIWHEGKLYQWPNYGTVQFQFKNCFAVSAAAPGSASRTETLAGARLINMFEVREKPHRIADISVAKREGDRVEARYQP
jgi:Peptidase A4 family